MLRTLLFAPHEFFERRVERLGGGRGLLVAGAAALALTLTLGVVLRLFTARMTGTVEVDNPAKPPASFCGTDSPLDSTPDGCGEPATVTREVGALVWEASMELLPWLFVAVGVLWLVFGVLLWAGGQVLGGDGGFGATLEVTAWGLVPTVLSALVAGAALVALAGGVDFGTSPESATATLESLTGGTTGLALDAVGLVGAAWQAYVWAGGLRAVHGLRWVGAGAVAGVVAVGSALLG
jgi:hypothetical protein